MFEKRIFQSALWKQGDRVEDQILWNTLIVSQKQTDNPFHTQHTLLTVEYEWIRPKRRILHFIFVAVLAESSNLTENSSIQLGKLTN